MTTPTAEIVHIPFHGSELQAVDIDGQPYVVLRPAVEALGLDYSSQLRKLQGRSWVNRGDIPTVGADGKTRTMAVVDVPTFVMWLATVNETKVADSVRDTLIAYQRESAGALYGYWANGGAVNPAATDEQLADLADDIERKRAERAKTRIELLALMGDAVDPRWRDSRMRHEYALVVGEKPDIAPEDRLLTVDGYLVDRGVSKGDLMSVRSTFGKRLKAAYMLARGEEPGEVLAVISGRERTVKAYYERDRSLFDEVFAGWYAHLAPAMLPGVAA